MMLKLCGCGKVIKIADKWCEECTKARTGANARSDYHKYYDKKRRNKTSQGFYHSTDWKRTRKAVLARDNYLCTNHTVHHRPTEAYAVDHIVPLSVDWSRRFDLSNLQSLCLSCHTRKTRREQSKAGRRLHS